MTAADKNALLLQRRAQVKNLHGTMSHRALARHLGISRDTVMMDCRALGLAATKEQQERLRQRAATQAGYVIWTPELEQELLRLYATMSALLVAERMGIRVTTVRSKLSALRSAGAGDGPKGVRRASVWTPAKDALLRERWPTAADTHALVIELEVLSVAAVYKRVALLGLKKAPAPKPPRPEPERVAPTVRRDAPTMTAAQIAQREQQRITYPPGQMPWKARVMRGATGGLPDLSHRSSHRAT